MNFVLDALNNNSEQNPHRVALISEDASLSYATLERKVHTLANVLSKSGATMLAWELDNGIDWIITDLAAMKAGLNSVPIPGYFTADQKSRLIRTAGVDLLICASSKAGLVQATDWQPLNTVPFTTVPFTTDLSCSLYRNEQTRACALPREGIKVTFTSGSTGQPRGVCLDINAIDQVVQSIVTVMEPIPVERHLCVLPLGTLLENIAGVYAPLVKGIEVAVPHLATVGINGSSNLDINAFSQTINRFRPDSLILVPQLLMALTTAIQFELAQHTDFSFIAVGGGKVSTPLLELSELLGLPVYEGYGLSEAASVVSLNLPGQVKQGTTGKPLPHADIRLDENRQILVRGALMRGYLGESGLEPIETDWLATGDTGCLDTEGFIRIDGRIKNMFVTSWGRNVNPEWMEAELGQHVQISQCLAFGEAKDHNLMLVWPRFSQTEAELLELISSVNARLPDYAGIHCWITMDDPLPESFLTANGRIRRDHVLAEYRHLIDHHYSTCQGEKCYGVL